MTYLDILLGINTWYYHCLGDALGAIRIALSAKSITAGEAKMLEARAHSAARP